MLHSLRSAHQSNVEILADLLGDKVDAEDVLAALKEGKSLSVQAQEAGVFDEFVAKIKEAKIARIDTLVANGTLTAERAKVMKDFIKNHVCDGTQQHAMRNQLNNGERFGLGQGRVNGGQGLGQANGEAAGLGQGNGPANGGRGGMKRGGMMGQGFGQGMMGQGYNAVTPAN
jgi:anti-sigma28 factor (negative regulator of flagellin synthesis)